MPKSGEKISISWYENGVAFPFKIQLKSQCSKQTDVSP